VVRSDKWRQKSATPFHIFVLCGLCKSTHSLKVVSLFKFVFFIFETTQRILIKFRIGVLHWDLLAYSKANYYTGTFPGETEENHDKPQSE
jgi:hypothetical protein